LDTARFFQVGEAVALDGRPLIDRQHPHDLLSNSPRSGATPATEQDGPDHCGRAGQASRPSVPVGSSTVRRHGISICGRCRTTRSIRPHRLWVITAALDTGRGVVEASVFMVGSQMKSGGHRLRLARFRYLVGCGIARQTGGVPSVDGFISGILKN